ncbi:CCA tRNA nucleotidyltransferase [uncultured Metabacillus sp.]|uniref:CCA tRNA nucleotidyltransferase n=1 Tax=Metabacillus sp. Hm71 TaxID=3450743 RepID=UPI0026215C9F|nr:CCA tRNA nucleotidyltransferase [uncultured Metabacillus sp.]
MNSPFVEARTILDTLHQAGYEAYYVGGAVRDFLLNRQIGDIDIATSAKPVDVQHLFKHTIDVGAEHGTIIVLHNGSPYEVTTFRAEGEYVDNRRPSHVVYISSLIEDLRRRDFTINAMAMDINGKIVDYFNGKAHLSEKLIQTVGSPEERFNEDALRMLRAVRFVSQLQFTLCPKTKKAISDHAHLLKEISVERKTVEIEKLLMGVNQKQALAMIVDTNMHSYLPGLERKKDELIRLSTYDMRVLKTNIEHWSLFTNCIQPRSVEEFLRKWKLPNKLIKAVKKNIDYLTIVKEKQWSDFLLYEAGVETAVSVERLCTLMIDPKQVEGNVKRIIDRFQQLPIQSKSQLNVTGHDIIDFLKKKPGPWVSKVIFEIEKAIVAKKLENNKSAIKEWLMTCNLDFDQNY